MSPEDNIPHKVADGSIAFETFGRVKERLTNFLLSMLQIDRPHKRMIVMLSDVALCLISIFISFSLRVGAFDFGFIPFFVFAVVAVILFVPIFVWAGVYATIFRFAGIGTIRDLVIANLVYSVPLVAIFMLYGLSGVPRTIAILHPMVFLGLTASTRILMRHLITEIGTRNPAYENVHRALIYGAGAAGLQLALSVRHEPNIAIVGFIDDDDRLEHQRLEGLKVHHRSKLESVIRTRDVDAVLLALPNISRGRRREIVESLREFPVAVKTLPQIQELVKGNVSIEDLREIMIEDLLGRDPVEPNAALLQRTIADKTVLVTGAGGSIGSELCRQILKSRPKKLVMVEMTEHSLYQIERELSDVIADLDGIKPILVPELMNLVDEDATYRLFDRYRPETVFHAAAYKHVPLVEANVINGMKNNIFGTINASRAATRSGVERFILISTDKAVRPTNVMGATKRVCEMVLQASSADSSDTRFAMVRFGNVLGSSGSVVPQFTRQIRSGGPVTLTHRDMTRYFMSIPEAAQLVIQAGAMAEGGEVYLLDMGASVKILDLARTMIELSGLSVQDDVNPEGDIAIVEIGLRPGEKLYEELLIDENSQPTAHPQISRAREKFMSAEEITPYIAQMHSALNSGQAETALAALKALVPEYTPKLDTSEPNQAELSKSVA